MGTTAEKLSYLNTTKTKIKEALNLGGANITTEPFREYADEIKDRYLDIMNNGYQDIWDSWDKVNGSGTSVSLNNTAKAPIKIDLNGNTSQYSTTGKNYLPITLPATTTQNGITLKYDSETGWITISGTATANVNIAWDFDDVQLPATTYVQYENDISSAYVQLLYYSNTSTYLGGLTLNGLNRIYNLSSSLGNHTIDRVVFNVANGTSANGKFRPMIHTQSTIQEWEKFTGGSASPNPNYPQTIHTVSGDNTIEVLGKNLLNITTVKGYVFSYGLPVSESASMVIDNFNSNNITFHTTTTGYLIALSNIIQLKPSTQYTIKFNRTSTSSNNQWFIYDYGNETYSVNFRDNNTNTLEHTFTTNSTGQMALAFGHGNTTGTTTISNIMLSSGATASTYEPYQSQSYAVNLGTMELCKIGTYQDKIDKSTGKNLFNNNIPINNSWVNQQGAITTINGCLLEKINCVGGQSYTFKLDWASAHSTDNGCMIAYYDKNDNLLSRNPMAVNSNTLTLTTTAPNNSAYMYVGHYIAKPIQAQLELGSTATTYEPYGTDWYLKKEIGKVVVNGSNISIGQTYSNLQYARYQKASDFLGYGNYTYYPVISDKAQNTTSTTYNSQDMIGKVVSTASTTYWWVGFDLNETLSDIQTKLNNAVIYYPLTTPTYETITDTTLISQLEEAKKSYESQTNISQENNDLPFELDVTGLANME